MYIWESDLSKMFTFMKIVITGVENWFPDTISVAFERKFDEEKDEIPPGIYRPHILEILNIGDGRTDIKPKNGHNSGHMGFPWPEFCMHLSTISTNIFFPNSFSLRVLVGLNRVPGGVLLVRVDPAGRKWRSLFLTFDTFWCIGARSVPAAFGCLLGVSLGSSRVSLVLPG